MKAQQNQRHDQKPDMLQSIFLSFVSFPHIYFGFCFIRIIRRILIREQLVGTRVRVRGPYCAPASIHLSDIFVYFQLLFSWHSDHRHKYIKGIQQQQKSENGHTKSSKLMPACASFSTISVRTKSKVLHGRVCVSESGREIQRENESKVHAAEVGIM